MNTIKRISSEAEERIRAVEEQRLVRAWRRYEAVRKQGTWNMLDTRAQLASGLDATTYHYVLEHYDELQRLAQGGA